MFESALNTIICPRALTSNVVIELVSQGPSLGSSGLEISLKASQRIIDCLVVILEIGQSASQNSLLLLGTQKTIASLWIFSLDKVMGMYHRYFVCNAKFQLKPLFRIIYL